MAEEKTIQQIENEAKERYERNKKVILQLVTEGKLPEPRKLTRQERKKLDAAGVNLFKINPTDTRSYMAVKEDMADWIMDTIYPKFPFDVDNDICLFFGEYIFGLSYKNDLAEKN